MRAVDLILIRGQPFAFVVVAFSFHLGISALPESPQCDLQGEFCPPSHQSLTFAGGSPLLHRTLRPREVMAGPVLILRSCLAVLKCFNNGVCLTSLQPPFRLRVEGVLLNAEQTKLWLTCCFDLREFIGARREEMSQGPWRD